MRILHVIPQFPWFGGRTIIGGHASCLLTLALAQAAAGDEPTILSYVQGRRGAFTIEPGVRVYSLWDRARPGTASYGLRFAAAAGRWAADAGRTFDVVHGHSGFADYFLASRRVRRTSRRPTVHTLYCPIPRRGGRWRRPIVRSLIRRWAGGLDGRLAMSRNVADSMRDYGLNDVTVVPVPVDVERFSAPADADAAAAQRRELGLGPEDVAVLFVGNAKPQKNMAGTLDAFAAVRRHHPHARLIVTTELKQSSSDEHLRGLSEQMSRLNLNGAVIQKGIVDDMPRLMAACDVLVAPFLDSFGPSDYFMAVLEAMACGRPVVVSNVGGMPEVVEPSAGRLVDPRDSAAITEALAEFVGDAAHRRRCGAAARQYAEQHFAPAEAVEHHRRIYQEVCA